MAVASSRTDAVKVRCERSGWGPQLCLGVGEGLGAGWQVSEKTAQPWGPPKTPAGSTEGKPRLGWGPAPLSLAPDRPADAVRRVSEASGHPRPLSGGRAPQAAPAPPRRPLGRGALAGPLDCVDGR